MYCLLTLFCVTSIYSVLLILNDIDRNKGLILLFFSILFGTLTHYYYYIIIILLVFYSLLVLIRKKDYIVLRKSILIVFTSIVLSWLVYPYVFKNIGNSAHLKYAIDNVVHSNYFLRIYEFYKTNFYGLIIPILAFFSVLFLFYKKKYSIKVINRRNILLIPYVFVGYSTIVVLTATFIDSRYLYPVAVLQLIIISLIFYKLFKYLKINKTVSFLIIVFITFVPATAHVNYLSSENTIKFSKNHSFADAVVVSTSDIDFNTTNSLMFDLINYDKIYFVSQQNLVNVDFCDGKEKVIYAIDSIDISKIDDTVTCSTSKYTLIDTGLNNHGFKIFIYGGKDEIK